MSAADRAQAETAVWVDIAGLSIDLESSRADPLPAELAVTGFDPTVDLERRARRWGHHIGSPVLSELARFAAGLAASESQAWADDDPIVATKAFEDRRFLFTDRVVHWAVPWADAAGRCHAELRQPAHGLRDLLLDLGDALRPAPLLTGDEGLHPPGEDSFGPTDVYADTELGWLRSGTVFFVATVRSLTGSESSRLLTPDPTDTVLRSDLASHFEIVAARWHAVSRARPGTARLWRDLAVRADATARWLRPDR